jgi:hypothetical protein
LHAIKRGAKKYHFPVNIACNIKRKSGLYCCNTKREITVLKRLNNFLEKEKIISNYQSGFRTNHCAKDHLLRLNQHINNNFNKNKLTSVVLFDMEKAFNRVWYQGLIYKLHLYNIPPYLLAWLSNFKTTKNRIYMTSKQGYLKDASYHQLYSHFISYGNQKPN